jgi:hypothetical protein
MIGKSKSEYVFIRLSIFALRAVAPFSILYLGLSALSRRWLFAPWCGYYALLEGAFYLFVYLPRHGRLQEVRIQFLLLHVAHSTVINPYVGGRTPTTTDARRAPRALLALLWYRSRP